MARSPKPWWREDRKAWFVTIGGTRFNLGPDSEAAQREFHRLMSLPPDARTPALAPSSSECSVADVFDRFLDWAEKHRAPRTYDWYLEHIQSFIDSLSHPDKMPVGELKPFHVVQWADRHPSWGANFRRGALIAIQRPFNWAAKLGYIPSSPIPYLEKPQPRRREQLITVEEWRSIRDHYAQGDPFRDLLEFAWETGCRPQEVKSLEARHVELSKHRALFPAAEAKGKKRIRIIYFTPRAEEILSELMKERSTGKLFLNSRGRPWTSATMSCRFARLKKHLGVKYCAYSLRHGFATRKLEEGIDHVTVAALMGHADATMLSKVYSHLGERHDHLYERLNRTAGS